MPSYSPPRNPVPRRPGAAAPRPALPRCPAAASPRRSACSPATSMSDSRKLTPPSPPRAVARAAVARPTASASGVAGHRDSVSDTRRRRPEPGAADGTASANRRWKVSWTVSSIATESSHVWPRFRRGRRQGVTDTVMSQIDPREHVVSIHILCEDAGRPQTPRRYTSAITKASNR